MRDRRITLTAIFGMLLLVAGMLSLRAQWLENGIAICTAPNNQLNIQVISDGSSGAIMSWTDPRDDAGDIYIQRIDISGDTLLAENGVAVCAATGTQDLAQMIPAGDGGAIVTWYDQRGSDGDIYAQRVDADGTPMWTPDGIPICTAAEGQWEPELASDGSGGAIIAWVDLRNHDPGNPDDPMNDIYAQRVSASGDTLWTGDGVPICTAAQFQVHPRVISDGAGGAIVVWWDERYLNLPPPVEAAVYAQRVDANGDTLWAKDGIGIRTGGISSQYPQVTSDGSNGAIVFWTDGHLHAQRIDASGDTLWGGDGVPICTAGGVGYDMVAEPIPDGSGGAIIAWGDVRNDEYRVYAQRVDANGDTLWAKDGVATSVADYLFFVLPPQLVSDGLGGAIVVWNPITPTGLHPYAQRIDANGTPQWAPDGIEVCPGYSTQGYFGIASNGYSGAFVAWVDYRNADYDIYAQRIQHDGQWGYHPAPTISAAQDVPRDQGGKIQLQWQRSCLDVLPQTDITHYSVWRRLAELQGAPTPAGPNRSQNPRVPIDFDGTAIRFASEGFAWEWLANVPSRHFEVYALTVRSLYDSMGTDPGWQYFMVSAQTSDPLVYYDSPVDSGYSVDNLSPEPPQMLAGEQVVQPEDGLRLTWDPNSEPDHSHYAVYRGLSADFTPGPGNLLGTPSNVTLFDSEWRWDSDYYYKVSALDVHGNESSFAFLGPDNVTGAGGPTVPRSTYLSANIPNPFNPSTTIAYGLEAPATVSLRIYDVSGKLVRVLAEGRREARHYREKWDGRDERGAPVASGVYFYRLSTGSFVETKKMVLIK